MRSENIIYGGDWGTDKDWRHWLLWDVSSKSVFDPSLALAAGPLQEKGCHTTLASHMQISIHIGSYVPSSHLSGSIMWPDNSTLRRTASSHGLFSHCREQQYQGTAAVWQECYPLFQQARLQRADSEMFRSSSCSRGFPALPRGRRNTQQQFHTGCKYLEGQHNKGTSRGQHEA